MEGVIWPKILSHSKESQKDYSGQTWYSQCVSYHGLTKNNTQSVYLQNR